MADISSKDVERVELLEIISSSKTGLKSLSKEQLERLHLLLQERDYGHDIKAGKSKIELLEKIDNRLYDIGEGRVIL